MTFTDFSALTSWMTLRVDPAVFAWGSGAACVTATLLVLAVFWCLVRRRVRTHAAVAAELTVLAAQHPPTGDEGLPASAYEDLRRILEQVPSLKHLWRAFNTDLVVRRGPPRDERVWRAGTGQPVDTDAAVIEPGLNTGLFSAVPGTAIVVGVILSLWTFHLAVSNLAPVRRVSDLDGLIRSLAAAVVPSVAALVVAIVFALVESSLLYQLRESRRRLVSAIDELVPRLPSARILADLQQNASDELATLQAFGAELWQNLERHGASLERIAGRITGLEELLRDGGTRQQTADVLHALLDKLKASIVAARARIDRSRGPAEPGRPDVRAPSLLARTSYLIIVRRDETKLFETLREGLETPGLIDVVWDRRVTERRQTRVPGLLERRKTDRRGTPSPTWTSSGIVVALKGESPGPGESHESACPKPDTRV